MKIKIPDGTQFGFETMDGYPNYRLEIVPQIMAREFCRRRSIPDPEEFAYAGLEAALEIIRDDPFFATGQVELAMRRAIDAATNREVYHRDNGHAARWQSADSMGVRAKVVHLDPETAGRSMMSPADDPDRLARQEALHRAIAELPGDVRDALTLHHLDGLTLDDCAERMGLSRDAVRRRCQRGQKLLAEMLK